VTISYHSKGEEITHLIVGRKRKGKGEELYIVLISTFSQK
jgi:hypothetical protein